MCYLPAKDHKKVAALLDRFVREESAEPRKAEAFLILADAGTALGNKALAKEAYQKCIEIPGTVFAYRARYQWAVEEIEAKNLTQAEEILKENLTVTSGSAAPDRDTLEKSLFKLASLVYQRQDYDKACIYLKQAVHQHPNNPNQLLARDQLGDCYRKIAERAGKKMETSRDASLKRERDDWLERGAVSYQQLAEDLDSRALQQPLGSWETALLRKARFAVADIRFDMGQYTDAIRRYQEIVRVYRRQLGGLVACLRLYRCCAVPFDDPADSRRIQDIARVTVLQTLEDLKTMDAGDEAFQANPEWTKETWRTRLLEVSARLSPTPATMSPAVRNP
jgi:tetratricopeptide (TPR) repeat protein